VKPDLLQVVEAAYADDVSEEDWLRGIGEAAAPELDAGLGVCAYAFKFENGLPVFGTSVDVGRFDSAMPRLMNMLAEGPPEIARRAFDSDIVSTLSEFFGLDDKPFFVKNLDDMGARDSIGVVVYDPRGSGVCLASWLPEQCVLPPAFKRAWAHIVAHLRAGMRLRRQGAEGLEPEAVLDLSGKLHDAIGAAEDRDARAHLRQAARAIDRARARRRSEPENAIEMWRALVSGRWSLVDQFEADGRHFLVARPNEVRTAPVRELTPREQQVAALAARGRSNKLIAYELGIALGTVATLLGRAARKLGVTSRTRLVLEWKRREAASAASRGR
jgi:DNA-binding NarL/FixJ family response regulator